MEESVVWKDRKFPIKKVTLFKDSPEEVSIWVGTNALNYAISPYLENTESEDWYDASCIDDLIGVYVSKLVFNMPTKLFEKYVEKEFYS